MQIRRKRDLSAFYKVDPLLLWFFNIVDYRKRVILTYFADNYAFQSHAPDISCSDNYLYCSYKGGANAGDDFGMPDWEIHDIIMRHSLHYLETNEQHKNQEHIIIAKEIDIRTSRFKLKKSEMAYGYSSTN